MRNPSPRGVIYKHEYDALPHKDGHLDYSKLTDEQFALLDRSLRILEGTRLEKCGECGIGYKLPVNDPLEEFPLCGPCFKRDLNRVADLFFMPPEITREEMKEWSRLSKAGDNYGLYLLVKRAEARMKKDIAEGFRLGYDKKLLGSPTKRKRKPRSKKERPNPMDMDSLLKVRLSKDLKWWESGEYAGERPWAYPLVGNARFGIGLLLNMPVIAGYVEPFDFVAWAEPHVTVTPQIFAIWKNTLKPKTVFASEAEVDAWFDANENALIHRATELFESDKIAVLLKKIRPNLDQIIPRCDRCGEIWTTWMTDKKTWQQMPAKWLKKILCWRCFLTIASRTGIEDPQMTLGFDWGTGHEAEPEA